MVLSYNYGDSNMKKIASSFKLFLCGLLLVSSANESRAANNDPFVTGIGIVALAGSGFFVCKLYNSYSSKNSNVAGSSVVDPIVDPIVDPKKQECLKKIQRNEECKKAALINAKAIASSLSGKEFQQRKVCNTKSFYISKVLEGNSISSVWEKYKTDCVECDIVKKELALLYKEKSKNDNYITIIEADGLSLQKELAELK